MNITTTPIMNVMSANEYKKALEKEKRRFLEALEKNKENGELVYKLLYKTLVFLITMLIVHLTL